MRTKPLPTSSISMGQTVGTTLLLAGIDGHHRLIALGDQVIDEIIAGVKGNRQGTQEMTFQDQRLIWAATLRKCLELLEKAND